MRAGFDVAPTACSAARITFLLLGRTTASRAASASTAATMSAVAGFMDWPPSTQTAPRLSKSRRLPAPAQTATTPHSRRLDGGGEALLAVGRLDVHVLDVDLLDHAHARAERERGTRLVRVEVHLDGAAGADDEERVAEAPELLLEPLGVDLVALDEERRAVAEARKLLVDRLARNRLEKRRRLRERLAADVRGDPTDDLEQAGGARVHDAGLPQDVELLRGAGESDVAVRDELGEDVVERRQPPGRAPPPSQPAPARR